MWRKTLAIIAGIIVVMLLLTASYLKSQSFMAVAVQSLSTEAVAFLGTKVEIETLGLNGLRTIQAGNVMVYDQSGERLFKADSVRVNFNLWTALLDRSLTACIDEVEVEQPEIFIYKQPNGFWNYEQLMPESDSKPTAFDGKVILKDGMVRIGLDGRIIPLEQVQATFDFAAQPAIAFTADFCQGAGMAGVSGSFGGKTLACSVKAKDFNMADYLDLLPPEMAFKVQGGMLKSVDVTILKESSGYQVDGEALVLGVDLKVADAEIKEIDGLILFDEKHLRLFSRGKLKEEPIVLRGKVSLDVVEPVVDLQVSSSNFHLDKVIEQVPIKGAISFKANVYGKYKEPTVDGVINMKEAEVYGYPCRDVEAKLSYENDKIIVESLQGTASGGRFLGSGIFNSKTDEYNFKVKTAQMPLGILLGESSPVQGVLNADLVLAGKGTDFTKALIYGNAQVVKGNYKEIAFDNLSVNLYKNDDKIVFDTIYLNLPQGVISGNGEMSGEQLSFQFQGTQVDLSELKKLDAMIQASGQIDFSGSAVGTLNNPEIMVAIDAKNGEVWQQPYQRAQGNILLKDHQLTVGKLLLTQDSQQHSIAGFMDLQGDKRLDFRIDSTAVRAENLIKLMNESGITGNVNNTVRVTGTLDNFVAEGKLDFYEGSIYDILVEKISGDYIWKNNQLFLNDFVISSPNIDVHLTGVMGSNKEMDFSVTASNVDFSKIRLQLPYPVSGTASFVGRLTGSMEAPIFKGDLTSEQLKFNERSLDDIHGEIIYKNNKIQLTSIAFKQNQGDFKLSGDFSLDSEKINGKLSVKKGGLADILAVANVKSGWIDGELDGEVILSGTVQDPYMQLSGLVYNGDLRGYQLNDLAIDLSADTRLIRLKKFRAAKDDSLLVGQGTIVLDGVMDLEFSGSNIDAALLTNLAGYDVPAQGTLNFGARITGKTNNPDAELSFDVQGGGIGTATFDTLYGLFRMENGIIQVEQLLAKKANYKASAYGIIPLRALKSSVDSNEDIKNQIDLQISLDEANLSILPFLTKEIDWAVGSTTGRVNLRGTLDKPLVYGNVAVHDGAVKFKALGKPLQNFEFNVDFSGDKVELKRFEGVMGKGSYQMTGDGYITGDGIHRYRFVLDLNKLEINNKYYTGPLEGQLLLEEDTIRNKLVPKLSGNLKFANCIFDIPPIPENEEQMPLVKLDLNIQLDKKVRLYNSFLYDILLEGNVNFSGNTRRPQSSGDISAVRGKIYYLKTPFEVRTASAYFNQVNSFLPSLNLEADTRLQRTRVYMQINGPADEMKIRLTSSPEMNESEIISLLTLRSRYYSTDGGGIGKEDLKALIGVGLQMSFLSEVENMMRNALGLDEFQVVRDTLANGNTKETDEVYNIEVGKYIGDKIMLRYVGGIDHSSYKYGIRYEFDNRISMTGNLNEDNEASFSVEARFKF